MSLVEKLEFAASVIGAILLTGWVLANLGLFAGMFAVIAKGFIKEHQSNKD